MFRITLERSDNPYKVMPAETKNLNISPGQPECLRHQAIIKLVQIPAYINIQTYNAGTGLQTDP
jgi:hypothetical protein